jgi:hypothetical protein
MWRRVEFDATPYRASMVPKSGHGSTEGWRGVGGIIPARHRTQRRRSQSTVWYAFAPPFTVTRPAFSGW